MPDDEQRLIVEYEATVEDVMAAYDHHSRNSPAAGFNRVVNFIFLAAAALIVLLIAFVIYPASHTKGGLLLWPLLVVPLVLWLILYANARPSKRKLRRSLCRDDPRKHMLGPRTSFITPDEVGQHSKYRKESVQWNCIHKIAVTPDNLFVYQEPDAAFVIPRRAFQRESSFQDFADKAIAYHNAAQAGGGASNNAGHR